MQPTFEQQLQPLLQTYCIDCHNVDEREAGIRVDDLNARLEDRHLRRWEGIRHQLESEAMPPEDAEQPTARARAQAIQWIDRALLTARARPVPKNGSIRRLTVAQYRNTLRDLLGLRDELTDLLPPDAMSKDGFVNNEQTLALSPILLEAYFEIANRALDRVLVDEAQVPRIQQFRMDLGRKINPEPCPDPLILGALSHLLENADFQVTQPVPEKPFDFEPIRMRTQFRFIEGYQGNDTVRGWREYDSIYHAVFACMRGTEGYPKGRAYETIPEGLLLRPAIPSAEIFQVESTYGPRANFKVSLRELPDEGEFRVRVTAAKYDDGLLLENNVAARESESALSLRRERLTEAASVEIPIEGIYQIDVFAAGDPQELQLQLGSRHFTGVAGRGAFLAVKLPAGSVQIEARLADGQLPERLVFTRLADDDPVAQAYSRFIARSPRLGVHLGLRRDCGSTLNPVGSPRVVDGFEPQTFVFGDAIANYPSPDVEEDNVNYLAGIREIGVRSEYTDGRDRPRLLIQAVEFEGPYFETWPPRNHRRIFFDSPYRDDPQRYARDILERFATRAYRRPVAEAELTLLMNVWRQGFAEHGDFQQSVRDALLVVLTSPQFLFQIETSESPEPEPLDDWELASKLAYFLWNTAPDEELLQRAADGDLRSHLDAEVQRLIDDPRFEQFVSQFAAQWLRLDKFEVVEWDREQFPRLSREVRAELKREPIALVQYLIRENRPLIEWIDADYLVANEVVAAYYDLGDRTESGFEFQPVRHADPHLGGVFSQAAILAGLSNGREANPVKRGAWFARSVIAEPPADPPPNVPALPQDEDQSLTLRQKLEQHRNQKGCANCHGGIDPWGLPFEQYDAAGRWIESRSVSADSTLPDGTEIEGVADLKRYLVEQRLDQVAFSVMKHLATYAVGRDLTYSELAWLRNHGQELASNGYRWQDMIRLVVQSPIFLEK